MRKKVLSLSLAVLMLVSLVGCGERTKNLDESSTAVSVNDNNDNTEQENNNKENETSSEVDNSGDESSTEVLNSEEITTETVTEATEVTTEEVIQIKDSSAYEDISNEKHEWYFVKNTEHEQPRGECVDSGVDLAKYDAYYVAPNADEKMIYLTFDCGYENGFTNKILDILKENDVKAMFFVTKGFIKDEPEIAKRMKEEGHLVGCHTVNHVSMPSETVEEIQNEILEVQNYFKEVTGYDIDKFIRPPMGEYSERTLQVTKDLGYKSIFWSIAYYDYDTEKQPGKDYVIQQYTDYYHNGAIPLIHNVSESNTQALDSVIKFLKDKGYSFGTLDMLSRD